MGKENLEKVIESAQKIQRKGYLMRDEKEAMSQGLELVEKSAICMLGTNGDDGFPNIKAMLSLKHEGLKKI